MKKYEVFFSAYAKFPDGTAATNVYDQLTLSLLIDVRTSKILAVGSTMLSDLAKERVEGYFINRILKDDLHEIIEDIDFCHQGKAKKPLMKATNDIYNNFTAFERQHSKRIAQFRFDD